MCRRATGAPFVTWFGVRAGDFQIIKGNPLLFNTNDHVTRSFCSCCGTHLSFECAKASDVIYVTSCSLDDPTLAPQWIISVQTRALPGLRLTDCRIIEGALEAKG
jgi:hypothetical protein